jgi:NADH dehydrogenase FAD-containing subunit
MEFGQRAFIVGANLENVGKTPPPPRHIFADIILIDKTQDSVNPSLYQIRKDTINENDDYLALKRNGYFSIDRNAFMITGTVVLIDKKKKIITLSNENTVSYNHLILANGIHPPPDGCVHDEEFVAGLHALLEALRVRKNLPEYLRSPEINELTKKYRLPIKLSLVDEGTTLSQIEKVVQPKMSAKAPESPNSIPNINDRKRFEVVL